MINISELIKPIIPIDTNLFYFDLNIDINISISIKLVMR